MESDSFLKYLSKLKFSNSGQKEYMHSYIHNKKENIEPGRGGAAF